MRGLGVRGGSGCQVANHWQRQHWRQRAAATAGPRKPQPPAQPQPGTPRSELSSSRPTACSMEHAQSTSAGRGSLICGWAGRGGRRSRVCRREREGQEGTVQGRAAQERRRLHSRPTAAPRAPRAAPSQEWHPPRTARRAACRWRAARVRRPQLHARRRAAFGFGSSLLSALQHMTAAEHPRPQKQADACPAARLAWHRTHPLQRLDWRQSAARGAARAPAQAAAPAGGCRVGEAPGIAGSCLRRMACVHCSAMCRLHALPLT